MGICLLVGSFVFFFIVLFIQMCDEEDLGCKKIDACIPLMFCGTLLFYLGLVLILHQLF